MSRAISDTPAPRDAFLSPATITSAGAPAATSADIFATASSQEHGDPLSCMESSARIVTTIRSPFSSAPGACGRSTFTPWCTAMSNMQYMKKTSTRNITSISDVISSRAPLRRLLEPDGSIHSSAVIESIML